MRPLRSAEMVSPLWFMTSRVWEGGERRERDMNVRSGERLQYPEMDSPVRPRDVTASYADFPSVRE